MKNILIIIPITLVIILFFAYASFHPASQIFGKVIYKNYENKIILTFDDGPGPETEQILDILKEYNVTAIFFIVGNHIQPKEEKVLQRIVAEGHQIGVHSMSHSFLWKNSYEELKENKEQIERITGAKVNYFRPPYGFRLPRTIKAAEKLNLTTMTWSLFTFDYQKNTKQIIKRVENKIKPSDIICMHDGPKNRQATTQALPTIIELIRT